MMDFAIAALPWVIMGITIAVITVNFNKNKEVEDQENVDTKQGNYMALGMVWGMCIGSILSTLNIVSISYGVSFGMLIGMTVGSCIKKH